MSNKTHKNKINTIISHNEYNEELVYEDAFNLKDKDFSVMSLSNNSLVFDIKKIWNNLDKEEKEIIKERALISAFTYNTTRNKSLSFEDGFISDVKNKYISLRNEYIMAKYFEENFVNGKNAYYTDSETLKIEKVAKNYESTFDNFKRDIEEKYNSIKELNSIDYKDFDKYLYNGSSLFDKSSLTNSQLEKVKEIDKIMFNRIKNREYFKADQGDFIFLDGTKLDIKTSNLNTSSNLQYMNKEFMINDYTKVKSEEDIFKYIKDNKSKEYLKDTLLHKYHSFISKSMNKDLNIYQNAGVSNDKIYTDIKDIVVQCYYNPTSEKLYFSGVTNEKMYKNIENTNKGRVGNDYHKDTLQQPTASSITPKTFMRYIHKYGAKDFTNLSKNDYISYENTYNKMYRIYRQAFNKKELGEDELLSLQNLSLNAYEMFNSQELRSNNKDELEKAKVFLSNLSYKQYNLLKNKELIHSKDIVLKEIRNNFSSDTSFFIHEQIKEQKQIKEKMNELEKYCYER